MVPCGKSNVEPHTNTRRKQSEVNVKSARQGSCSAVGSRDKSATRTTTRHARDTHTHTPQHARGTKQQCTRYIRPRPLRCPAVFARPPSDESWSRNMAECNCDRLAAMFSTAASNACCRDDTARSSCSTAESTPVLPGLLLVGDGGQLAAVFGDARPCIGCETLAPEPPDRPDVVPDSVRPRASPSPLKPNALSAPTTMEATDSAASDELVPTVSADGRRCACACASSGCGVPDLGLRGLGEKPASDKMDRWEGTPRSWSPRDELRLNRGSIVPPFNRTPPLFDLDSRECAVIANLHQATKRTRHTRRTQTHTHTHTTNKQTNTTQQQAHNTRGHTTI